MQQPNIDDLSQISLSINEAFLDQTKWQSALKTLAHVFNGSFATFEVINKNTGTHLQHLDCSDIKIQEEYIHQYMPLNPRFGFGARPDSPKVMHDNMFMSDQEIDRNEFYMDFLRPHDLRYYVAYNAYETADKIGVFTIQRAASPGPASDQDMEALTQLTPLLSRAADFQIQYSEVFSRMRNLEHVMNAVDDGVVLIDKYGAVIEFNSSAERIFDQNDGIAYSKGKLVCAKADQNQRMRSLILHFARGREANTVEGNLLISRTSGLPPYQIRVQNIAKNEGMAANSNGVLLLFIRDTSRASRIQIISLVEGFNLTPAEASVAISIANGTTAQEISVLSSVSLSTTRTHIQHIMQKMSVKRQIDIARILARYL